MDRVLWKMAASRHPGLISNMIVNALVSHMITFKYHSVVPLNLPIP